MSIAITRTQFNDFEILRDAWQDSQLDILQVESGPMRGTMSHFSLGSIGISTGSYTRGIRSTGLGSDSRWAFCTQIESVDAMMNNIKIHRGDQTIIRPNTEFDFANERAGQYVATFIEPDEIFGFLQKQQPGAVDSALWREDLSVQTVGSHRAAGRVRAFQMLIEALEIHGPKMSAATTEFHKRNIMELIVAPIRNAVPYHGAHASRQHDLVRDIRHYLKTVGSQPIHVSTLCELFHTYPRALFRAFHDVIGISPINYLRMKRLNDVHTALRQAGPNIMVQDIAVAHGFIDLGRFAAAYQHMFGELPRQTLRRSIASVVPLMLVHQVVIYLNISAYNTTRILAICDDLF